MEEQEIYKQALDKWGLDFQLLMLQEECAELIVSVSKLRRGKGNEADMRVEMVDVSIMIEQIRMALEEKFHFLDEWEHIKNIKLNKVQKMLREPTHEK